MSDKQPKSDPAEHGEKQSQDDSVSGAPKPASRHWAWRHKLLVVIGVFVSLGFAHYLLTRPTDNPQPQKKIVVRGSFPYDRGWDLRIEASYYSKNPTCKQTARAFFIFLRLKCLARRGEPYRSSGKATAGIGSSFSRMPSRRDSANGVCGSSTTVSIRQEGNPRRRDPWLSRPLQRDSIRLLKHHIDIF